MSWVILESLVENSIHEMLGSDVFRINLEWSFVERGQFHLSVAFLVPSSLNAVIDKSNQTGSHDDTVGDQ